MVTVRAFVENNENENVKIRISECADREKDYYGRKLYEGMLFDVPEELKDREVVSEGFLLVAQMNELVVLNEKGE